RKADPDPIAAEIVDRRRARRSRSTSSPVSYDLGGWSEVPSRDLLTYRGGMSEQVPGRVGGTSRDPEKRVVDRQAKNERLVAALTAARTQLVELRAQLEEMTRPPGSYAVFVRAHKDRSIDVMSSGRKLRVGVSPSIEI